ncbi:MAG: replication initiator protein [Arizlama microvirus]|nr:MAG: replication initiator protein [Arizlama microvirus]
MPCYHPISAWQLLNVKTANGKPTLSFKNPFAKPTKNRVGIQVPCGLCIGCALEKSRQWAVRCVHESQMHDDSAFVTLTYDPKYLPSYGSLQKGKQSDQEYFLKNLRQAILPSKIKFFMCGEYGDKNTRPHYHYLIFGYGFPDRKFFQEKNGVKLYTSELLSSKWPYGFSTCGNISMESAAYVARYCLKKVQAREDASEMDADNFSGQIPEYVNMSRGGRTGKGLGYKWYTDYKSDVFPCDNVVVAGKMGKPPRYYDKQFELDNYNLYEKIKLDRKIKAINNASDNTTARLLVKEICKKSQISQLKRGLENEV